MTTLEERSAERRKRIVANRAASFEEAEKWDEEFRRTSSCIVVPARVPTEWHDVEYWLSRTSEERLSALPLFRRIVGNPAVARKSADRKTGGVS